ncbi:MAG TPA: hypothetical protein PK709_19090, partial [Cyclobacteriaceae bacterium]|nr:hypothetical protein [Cyclobacteriaceae bacterium]
GWLPLLALLAVTLFLALNVAPIMAVLAEALDDLDLPPGMIAAGTLLLLNVFMGSIVYVQFARQMLRI